MRAVGVCHTAQCCLHQSSYGEGGGGVRPPDRRPGPPCNALPLSLFLTLSNQKQRKGQEERRRGGGEEEEERRRRRRGGGEEEVSLKCWLFVYLLLQQFVFVAMAIGSQPKHIIPSSAHIAARPCLCCVCCLWGACCMLSYVRFCGVLQQHVTMAPFRMFRSQHT